jgi:DNA (cytosine-5)-methyltransferase 1
MRRIAEGVRRYWGAAAEPFLVVLRHYQAGRSLDLPMPTITGGGIMGLCTPFVHSPLSGGTARSTLDPLPTITATCRGMGLVMPFGVPSNYGERAGQVPRTLDLSRPMPTVTTRDSHGVVTPFLAAVDHQSSVGLGGVGEPVSTVTTKARHGLVMPYYRTGVANTLDVPLQTVTTRDRLAIAQSWGLDILYRMLQPHELAAAMGFPASYAFSGNREQVVKQIGNSVPVGLARALALAMLREVA